MTVFFEQLTRAFAPYRVILRALAMAAGALALTAIVTPPIETKAYAPLRGAPEDGSVYFIGNSMFGTGLDVTLAQSLLPKEKVSFGYYDGHYTTMWYSAFRNSLLPSGIKPKVVIWGALPSLRTAQLGLPMNECLPERLSKLTQPVTLKSL